MDYDLDMAADAMSSRLERGVKPYAILRLSFCVSID